MGERKGTNKYYPPDFDPSKHRSLNAYHGVHALRERGRKADKGIIIIRFEMPYNSWCLSCKQPIGMGVRYNAEKTKVGMYHSTPIFQFAMNCAMCAGRLIMQTDPQNFDYICVEGIRRKVQTWDPEDNEQIVVPDYKERQKFALDAMYQIEHGVKDKEKAMASQPVLSELEADREVYRDDFALNYLARQQFRESKAIAKAEAAKDDALKSKLSLSGSQVTILPESEDDVKKAKLIRVMRTAKNRNTSLKTNEPLIQSSSRTPLKRKSTESYAVLLTKEKVTSHWRETRSNAFSTSTSEPSTNEASSLNATLSQAIRSGSLRKVEKATLDSGNKTQTDEIDAGGSNLVAYGDSD